MNSRITLDPSIHHGKPVIKGTRVPVATVIGAMARGMSAAQVAVEYEIESADIEEALLYAADLIEHEKSSRSHDLPLG